MDGFLFDPGEPRLDAMQAAAVVGGSKRRLRLPQRDQVEMQWFSLDQMLDPDPSCQGDLGGRVWFRSDAWLQNIKAVEGHVGRDATDPRILVALWVFATLEGIGSARRLSKLCEEQTPFRWLCGGVGVNYDLLSRFRAEGSQAWDDLLTHLVGSLMAAIWPFSSVWPRMGCGYGPARARGPFVARGVCRSVCGGGSKSRNSRSWRRVSAARITEIKEFTPAGWAKANGKDKALSKAA